MTDTANRVPLGRQLKRRKPIREQKGPHSGPELERSFGTFQLTMFGVGATVGTGIFFVLQEAVPDAGPAVVISFLVAGLGAGLSALCYAELASAIPVSGSTYSYAYHSLGELMAMVIAACVLPGVRRVELGRGGGLEWLLQRAHRQPVRGVVT